MEFEYLQQPFYFVSLNERMKKLLLLFILISLSTKAQTEHFPDTINKKKLAGIIVTESVFYVAGVSYLSFWWYKDDPIVPFEFFNDNAGYLQMDKFGHALTAYKESYLGYYSLRRAGVSRNKALYFGGPLGLFLQTPIEVLDGMFPGWGFSWGDMIANASGSLLLVAQELAWKDQIIKLKMSYQRSQYADLSPKMLGNNQLESFFYDYNGHTYWLSANLNKIVPIKQIPNWLNISFGYSANGMTGEFSNYTRWGGQNIPPVERYRQFLFSLDLDWTKIKTKNKILKSIFRNLLVVKFPFPTLEYNPKNGLLFHPIYF